MSTGKLDRYGFAKSGPGTFRHTGTSNLSMALAIYAGVFEAASPDSFSPSSKGNYYVYLNGGTLKTSVDITLARPLSVGDNGGVIEVVANTVFTQTGTTVTTTDNTSGPIVKRGAGTWDRTLRLHAVCVLSRVSGTDKRRQPPYP